MLTYNDVKYGQFFVLKDGSVCYKSTRGDLNENVLRIVKSDKYVFGDMLFIIGEFEIDSILGDFGELY